MKNALALAACLAVWPAGAAAKDKAPELSPLDRYIQEASARAASAPPAAAGSTWVPGSHFADLAVDVRASRVDDLVTVLVVERASAVAKGTVKTSRESEVKSSIGAVGGPTRASGPLAGLLRAETATALNGEGTTSRETLLTTTLAARVTHVLPNGYLVVEGAKDVQVNSERQMVVVRGVVRPEDIAAGNLVRSDRLAQLEVRVNGKGVVADAIRRPFFLYRLLLGILPF